MSKDQQRPPVKIAVLIDGGFFLKRFNALYNHDGKMSPEEVVNHLYTMAHKHVGSTNKSRYLLFFKDENTGGTRLRRLKNYLLTYPSYLK